MIAKRATIAKASLLLASPAPIADAVAQPIPASAAISADPAQTDLASGDEIHAQVDEMFAEMAPGQGLMWRPLVSDGDRVAAIEIWKMPGRPAAHPTEAEYVVVLEGAGTLVSGGTLIAPVASREGLIEGEQIDGGISRTLGPGDVLLIPAGLPHWFGVTGDHLVLLGTKMPVNR